MRKLFIVPGPFPPSNEDIVDAQSAGASEIMHLGDPAVAALGITDLGYAEIVDDPPMIDVALKLLDKTDVVSMRCFKAGVAFPPEWQSYTLALREVVRGNSFVLPVKPPYPADT